MDDQFYLEPGFDPSSLTMPKLRSILVAHSVDYPASSKKPQLVEIFNAEVLPQARKLRAASARVRRTSRGIENIPSQNGSVVDEEEVLEPAVVERPRSTRRTTRSRTEEVEEVVPVPRSGRHSTAPPERMSVTPRRASSKHARPVEVEVESEAKRPASRKARPSAVTPSVRRRDGEEDDDDTPFSDQNVFQSGGSPPAPSTADKRRTTLGPSKALDPARKSDVRRRTEEHRPVREQVGGVTVPSRKTFEMPVARAVQQAVTNDIEPDEEFTPDEQQALVQGRNSGELVPARPKKKASTSSVAKTGPAALLTAMLAGLATLYRQEKVQVGYCGVGQPSTEIAGVAIPDWADIARPQCEPCPPHAYCHVNLQTECEPGFVLTPNPLSLNGLVPLPPSCAPDSQRARKVQAVKQRAVEELREHNAKFECGETAQSALPEASLKETISTKRRKGMSNEEFEDLWSSALGEIQNADEIISASDGITGFTLRSTSLARIPLACAVRRSLRQTFRRYLWQALSLLALLSLGAYTRYRITDGKKTEVQAQELARLALRKLSERASLAGWGEESEAWISMAQLRDDVLRDEFSGTKRKNLWTKVQKKVEGNANVRPMVREGRTGDVGRVWEWIGARSIENTPGSAMSERRKSGGGAGGLLAGEKLIEAGKEERVNGGQQTVKWEEGRGSYY
ncbi:hypothetical protein B0A48_03201 [Cryoendolithus antarcticus]|uniref:LEM-like domain-containing protein n=1 Tax=Cryoendolithus antarcticus TaxID=1507870 RepID=A0A1V8TJJ5_9PEZI|nr:hypothetical protein B0A48_03201 [Cryoendolithus antarcticus]